MPEAKAQDEFADIGEDALLPLLKAVRKVVDSEAFQKRLVDRLDDLLDLPYFPDALEGPTMDKAYDIVQQPTVKALDDWIADLEK